MKYLSILGSTGSIGDNVLDIVRQFPDRFQAVALAAGTNVNKLIEQIAEFRPELVSLRDAPTARILRERLPKGYSPKIVCDTSGHIEVATFPKTHTTISAMVGAVGLEPTLAAIAAGKNIGLANKETLVMAGRIVMDAVHRHGVQLLPIDSEHSAIFQALEAGRKEDVKKIILTASGGPFRGMTRDALQTVTPQDALRHPNWSMGQKISIDSATLMNKGLEVIEARWLFDVAIDDIEVLVHPQSIIHSMVEYQDGSLVAQLGIPDMRIPIAYALAYPERLPLSLPSLTLAQCSALEFLEPDHATFPSLKLACAAGRQGGVLPAVLNAANEIAVAAFLANKISFSQIFETVVRTMDIVKQGEETDLQAILQADQEARKTAEQLIAYRLSQ